jgi:DNA-binding MarR family transcriptional regulator
MTLPETTEADRKLLLCLLLFYREQGPGAAPAIKGIGEEADLQPWDVEDAVKSLRAKGLIEYWPLQPAIRLTAEGLALALALDGGGAA